MKGHPNDKAESLLWRGGCKNVYEILFFTLYSFKNQRTSSQLGKAVVEKSMRWHVYRTDKNIIFTFEQKILQFTAMQCKKIKHDFRAKKLY